MSLTPADLEALTRIIDERIKRALNPVEGRVKNHSISMRAIREEELPAVTRRVSDSQEVIEGRVIGFERIVLDSLTAMRQENEETRELVKSIPPGVLGAERAAHRTEGKTDAIQVAADRADANSLKARVKANQAFIAIIVTAVLKGIWDAYQAISHMGSP